MINQVRRVIKVDLSIQKWALHLMVIQDLLLEIHKDLQLKLVHKSRRKYCLLVIVNQENMNQMKKRRRKVKSINKVK